MRQLPPISTLFPYTTLFRSAMRVRAARNPAVGRGHRHAIVLAYTGVRSRIQVAVRIREGIDRTLQGALELAPAVAHFALELRRGRPAENRVRRGVRADGHDRRIHTAQLLPVREVEFV